MSRSDASPVIVEAGSQFILRGRLESSTAVYFGIRVNHPNGEFAGMFRGDLLQKQPAADPDDNGEFVSVYSLENFTIDPAVWDKRSELASRPDGLVLDGVWAFTLGATSAGLEVTQVELLPQSIQPDNN